MKNWSRTDESIDNTVGFGHRPMVIRLPEEEFHG